MQVFRNIHVLPGVEGDCNVYIADDELVIDTGTGRFFPDMKREIESISDIATLKTIINTHHHFDHTGGNKKFRDWLCAEIHIHQKDRDCLESGETLAEAFGERPRVTTVDRLLKDKSIIKTKNFRFEVIHTPGHTPGSVCLYDRAKRILISGDTISGRTDFPGGSREDMTKSLRKLSELNISYLFPGHGAAKSGGVGFVIKQAMAGIQKNAAV
ncbi:MAG: MBL fold metallo-hydrolase [Candidatus Aenigmarchaeota archaeon]|nr:MBL fold metallo-hydrolase [Candidatus Aenigmarchaeota archaeon]